MTQTATEGVSLDLAGEDQFEPPTADDIAAAVRRRPRGEDWYLTLEGPDWILDATAAGDGRLRLVIEEGERRREARVDDDDALLTDIFASVLAGDGRWPGLAGWEEPPPPAPAPTGMAAIAAIPAPALAGIGLMVLVGLVSIFPESSLPGFVPEGLRPSGARVALLFALALPGFIALAAALKEREVRRAARWTQGRAEIVSSGIMQERIERHNEATRTVNKPAVAYEFSVGLKRHRGTRISIGEIAGDDPEIPRILQRYKVGASVPVYYDPANPGDCVLERDLPAGFGVIYVLAGALAVIAVGITLVFLLSDDIFRVLGPYFPKGAHPPMAVFFAGAALFLFLFFLASRRHDGRAAGWSRVAGRVVASRVESRVPTSQAGRIRPTVYSPFVEYAYRVGSQEYRGSRLALGADVAAGQAWAQRRAAAFPEGREVVVHYNPANPAESALETRGSPAWVLLSFAFVFVALAAFFATH